MCKGASLCLLLPFQSTQALPPPAQTHGAPCSPSAPMGRCGADSCAVAVAVAVAVLLVLGPRPTPSQAVATLAPSQPPPPRSSRALVRREGLAVRVPAVGPRRSFLGMLPV